MRQLSRAIQPFEIARTVQRPSKGWLAAVRTASAISLRDVATVLGVRHQTVAYLEKAEAEDKITLKKLRETADALGCDLVYGLVPRKGSLETLQQERAKREIRETVAAVEHTMALEDQAVGNLSQKIEDEYERSINHAA
jgi:predicted DNA-binding mobile mystery protein A